MFDEYETGKDQAISSVMRGLEADAERNGKALFVEGLFRQASAEDICCADIRTLEALADDAWRHFQQRPPAAHRLRVFDPDWTGTSGEPVTVIEVLNDDMPFLFGSVLNELQARGLQIGLVLHPIYACRRDAEGRLVILHGLAQARRRDQHESLVHIEVPRMEDRAAREELEAELDSILIDVRRAVADWQPMLDRVRAAIRNYEHAPPAVPEEVLSEAVAFLNQLIESEFTFLGLREYRLVGTPQEAQLEAVEGSSLGILRDPSVQVLRRGDEVVAITPEIREFLAQPDPLIITKANLRARVHRRTHLDYVGIKLYDHAGELSGELRVVGLLTSDVYAKSVLDIPLLRGKVRHVMQRLGYREGSHSGKALLNILETYPRDELFQIDEDLLAHFARIVLALTERPRPRVLPRIDKFDRFVSILVYVPRDRFNTQTREAIERYLAQAYDGHLSARYIHIAEMPLVRLHVIVGRYEGVTPQPERAELEQHVAEIIRTWRDDLVAKAREPRDDVLSPATVEAYADAFPESYRATYDAGQTMHDIRILETIDERRETAISFFKRPPDSDDRASLKIVNRMDPVPLSSRVPILEAMGFVVVNERTFRVKPVGGHDSAYIHDMNLTRPSGAPIDIETMACPLEEMFLAVWGGRAENDQYNGLLLNAGIEWRDVAMLRAYGRYLQQAGVPFTQDFLAETLNAHPEIAVALVRLFGARFDPDRGEEDREAEIARAETVIEELLNDVASLNEDTVIRRFRNLVTATLRTSFFMRGDDGGPLATLSFKLDPQLIEALPKPRPYREIWVYSPRVEGVHLRFGAVARGGIRWSDRPQDFRTEVLGLVKAQQVKNAVIVPVGAKGGFFPKRLPPRDSRDAYFREGHEAYQVFIEGLLAITDDIEDAEVVPPPRVLRRDGNDPYLVVAADKGTATFSDTANAISEAHGFWLGDAFASGGSAGYDHKAMGITARGAWEAVKRHFREMDRDIQTTPFTCIGIGDMSGDVFGNGMLLSKATKLVAAFNHLNIVIDPDPDPETSWAERKRLFDMPRSSWQDYDSSKLSPGGGIYSRAAKSIDLSAEARAMLRLGPGRLTPNEVLRAILKAEADLLWLGGIGTYVRASGESHADVGDKANDAIRVTAAELNVKVIGEGANLGVTQMARIEFCLAGGKCNSDAIDNSAGVNTSDVEVNIKIALRAAERSGRLDRDARNRLLVEMTEDVAGLVLRNNYLQTLAISLSERRALDNAGYQLRLMDVLSETGGLDREIEFLPSDADLMARVAGGHGLTRPEIGVLLAYAKITLYNQLVDSAVPDDPYLGREIVRYFPPQMAERFAEEIQAHRLRREIIATMLSNSMINRGGATFAVRIADQTGAGVDQVARAFAATRDSFALIELNTEINGLDNLVSGELQLALYHYVRTLTTDGTIWFVRNSRFADGIEAEVARFQPALQSLADQYGTLLPEAERQHVNETIAAWSEAGVPETLAMRIALVPYAISALNILLVCESSAMPLHDTSEAFFLVNDLFRFGKLEDQARSFDATDFYDELALDRARRMLSDAHRRISRRVLMEAHEDSGGGGVQAKLDRWVAARGGELQRIVAALDDIIRTDRPSVARMAVAASLLSEFAEEAA